MSQAGLCDIEASHPQIPTSFTTDAGTAIPLANDLEILGTNGLTTSAAGKTVTVTGVNATAGATVGASQIGVAAFDSAHFNVTAGFVQLSGGIGMETFLTDDGAPAVEPDGTGQVSILGGTGIDVTGQGPGNTITVSGEDSTVTNKGIVLLATDAQSIAGALTNNYAINPSSLKAKLGVQTDHGIALGTGTGTALNYTAVGATGKLLIGNTGADPAFGSTAYADFSFSNITAVATPRMLTVVNTDVNAASHADLRLSTPPLGGDSMVSWEVQGSHFFAAGVDNQVVGDPWKLSNSSHPSAGTAAITVDATTAAVTLASAYEFPVADGNASEVLVTDGAGNLDFAAAGSLLTDLDNILFVGKHGADANNGKTPNNAKLTIQAAVTAAAAGDTIIVFPGTYTETVTHAANNVTLIAEGKTNTVIITQADANVIDFATFTGIQYKYFGISCTAATTAINTVQGSTGGCTFKECNLAMICTTAIAAVIQPAVGSITGAGELKVTIGKVTYTHSGAGGGTAQKGAFRVADGGEVTLQRINDLAISCSGTALVTSVGLDTASTGVFLMNDNKITVTDPNATIVTGFAYLGGTGTTHEYFRNTLHVVATNNIGYGFFSADTASNSRFFYNHIHVEDTAGSSYSFLVGSTATVISQFDDIIADDGVSVTAGGTFTCTSSEMDGELTCRGREAAGTVQASIMNMDNTASAGNAALNLSVGGATTTGDPYVNFLVTGSNTFSVGQDNSVANDPFKITTGATPSAGTDCLVITSAGAATFANTIYATTFDTNVAAAAVTLAGTTLAADGTDANIDIDITPKGTGVVKANSVFTGGGTPTADGGNTLGWEINDSNAGLVVFGIVKNTDNTNVNSHAQINLTAGGTSGGDPKLLYQIVGGTSWVTGTDNSDSDKFKVCIGTVLGTNDTIVATIAGEVTMPLQPAFSAYSGSLESNVTGSGTQYTVHYNTEIYDQNADYNNGTYTFTAPVTIGRYSFVGSAYLGELDALATTGIFRLITSNRTYVGGVYGNYGAMRDASNYLLPTFECEADMDAADTAYITIQVSNMAGDTVDINYPGHGISFFSGHLEC